MDVGELVLALLTGANTLLATFLGYRLRMLEHTAERRREWVSSGSDGDHRG